MDYDNDGVLDFISGSYDPGDLYLFRGTGNGGYAAVENILDKSGLPVVHHPEEFAKYQQLKDDPTADPQESVSLRVASFGSWAAPVDWEADGDLDLLIGSFSGDLFLRINEGTREQPVYGTESIPVEAAGEPLHVNMHAAPVVADWNGDGLWDLVVGSGDGAVGWFANQGTPTVPKFGPYQQLVSPASDSKFFEQNIRAGEAPTHGVRAQICVTDYNHDGRLDLILGDYSDVNSIRDLTKAQQADFDRLLDTQARMFSWANKFRQQFYEDQENEQLKQKFERFQLEYEKLNNKKQRFVTNSGSASFIWLFLRRDPVSIKSDPQPEPDNDKPSTAKSKLEPVAMTAKLSPLEDRENQWRLYVDLKISPGWHVYRRVPAGSPLTPTSVLLELPVGIEALADWEMPTGMPSPKDPRQQVLVGRATFTRDLKITPSNSARSFLLKVHYQTCNDQFCLPAALLEETVAVPK